MTAVFIPFSRGPIRGHNKDVGISQRRAIMEFLARGDATVREIAAEVRLTPSTVHHHLKRLIKKEAVTVVRPAKLIPRGGTQAALFGLPS